MSSLGLDASTATAATTILHWVDNAWTGVQFTPTDSGIHILRAARLQPDHVQGWLGDTEEPVRVVVPSAATLARAIDLGTGDEASLEERLQAELTSRLGDSAPPHRLAASILPTATEHGARLGILLGWPTQRDVSIPTSPESTLAVPDIVALLSALGRETPDAPLLWHDPADGSTAMVLTDGRHLALRSTQVPDFRTRDAWQRFIIESALQAGWPADQARALAENNVTDMGQAPALRLPEHLAARMKQRWTGECPDEPQYQIAIGCALATTDDLAGLTILRAAMPLYEPTFVERWTDRLSDRRTAAKLAIALVILFLMGPIVFSGIRLGLLRVAHGSIDQAVLTASVAEQRNKMYAQLGGSSLPITKILADITAATPLGITIESVRMGTGEPLRIKGDATNVSNQTAAELIGELKSHMQASRVFKDVTVEWDGQSNLGARAFSVSAQIATTALRPSYPVEQDFAAWTHQQRDHRLPTTAEGGPPAQPSLAASWDPNAAAEAAAARAEAEAQRASRANSDRPTSGNSGAAVDVPAASGASPPSSSPPTNTPKRSGTLGGSNRPDRGGGGLSASDTGAESLSGAGARSGDLSAEDMGALPEILTQDQIATLTKQETLNRVMEVSSARKLINDPEVLEQLRQYSKQLFDHLHSLPAEGAP
ncbi:MAG: hypothetical protein MK100_06740 [Phycisphaerales bacterium]|nr:hypothetical protein [Phycisphaerales bacterium]